MENYYTVTVFDKLDLPDGLNRESYSNLMIAEVNENFLRKHYGDIWTCGVFMNEEDAIRVVEENITDIQETCYGYAIVETYTMGLYPFMRDFKLYKWDGEKFVRCTESPLFHVGFQGFTFQR